MNLRLVGLNHHTATIDVRESLAFSPEQVHRALETWQDTTTELEAVLLSTCNRTEFYVATENGSLPSTEELLTFLLKQKGHAEKGFPLASQILTLTGIEAAEHLFSVASSLDSMVLGEAQILGQVRDAYQAALEAETVGSVTHALFQAALKTAKSVATETDLHKHRVSIPSIAVADFALRIFERLDDKRIVLFGAGDMGQETLRYLCDQGARSVTVVNRHRDKAETLAAPWNGTVVDWENRLETLADADIVVSTTGATEPIVTLAEFQTLESRRAGRTLFVLDLAVPRDFEPAIADCRGVYLYSVDDLQETCERNRSERDREIPKAERIVRKSAERFIQDQNHRRSGAVIQQLRKQWGTIKDAELHRLFNKLPDLDEKERDEIQYAFERLLGKFLHPPLESLRDESEKGVPHKLLDALARLFQLREG